MAFLKKREKVKDLKSPYKFTNTLISSAYLTILKYNIKLSFFK